MEKESASATKAADAFYFKCTIKLQIVQYHLTGNVLKYAAGEVEVG